MGNSQPLVTSENNKTAQSDLVDDFFQFVVVPAAASVVTKVAWGNLPSNPIKDKDYKRREMHFRTLKTSINATENARRQEIDTFFKQISDLKGLEPKTTRFNRLSRPKFYEGLKDAGDIQQIAEGLQRDARKIKKNFHLMRDDRLPNFTNLVDQISKLTSFQDPKTAERLKTASQIMSHSLEKEKYYTARLVKQNNIISKFTNKYGTLDDITSKRSKLWKSKRFRIGLGLVSTFVGLSSCASVANKYLNFWLKPEAPKAP
jgi:hypothetical protein